MSNTQATLSDHNAQVFNRLDQLAACYPISLQQLEDIITDLQLDQPEEASLITARTDGVFKRLLMTLLVRKRVF
jgi:hypothetical protein